MSIDCLLWANLPLIVVHDELWARYLWAKLSLTHSITCSLSRHCHSHSFWLSWVHTDSLWLSLAHRLLRSLLGWLRHSCVASVYQALIQDNQIEELWMESLMTMSEFCLEREPLVVSEPLPKDCKPESRLWKAKQVVEFGNLLDLCISRQNWAR